MDLYGEVALGVDELDEQRELSFPALVGALAQQFGAVEGDDLGEGLACQWAVADDGFLAGHGTDFPTLADAAVVGFETFEGAKTMAAPDDLEHVVLKEEGIEWWFHSSVEGFSLLGAEKRKKEKLTDP